MRLSLIEDEGLAPHGPFLEEGGGMHEAKPHKKMWALPPCTLNPYIWKWAWLPQCPLHMEVATSGDKRSKKTAPFGDQNPQKNSGFCEAI